MLQVKKSATIIIKEVEFHTSSPQDSMKRMRCVYMIFIIVVVIIVISVITIINITTIIITITIKSIYQIS